MGIRGGQAIVYRRVSNIGSKKRAHRSTARRRRVSSAEETPGVAVYLRVSR